LKLGWEIAINKVSLVVSAFNEEDVLQSFWDTTKKYLNEIDVPFEVIFVNDGSHDNSLTILRRFAEENKNIRIINFSRNFGHEAAMIAGIDNSSGDVVICMDADLQHPPSKIKEMIEKYSEGHEIINMVRIDNKGARLFRRLSSSFFYYFLNKISPIRFEPHASDFFLISRRIANILKSDFRERARFLRGFIQIIGFKKATIEFTAPERAAGKSKYSLFTLFKFSINAIATFSNLPLHLGVLSGIIIGILSILIGMFSIVMKFLGFTIPGYTTIVVLVSFLFAVQLFITGMIGEYIGFLFTENKKRPIYIVEGIIRNKDAE
jgi:polyisoprenyl-phosphate glycosyltransferase